MIYTQLLLLLNFETAFKHGQHAHTDVLVLFSCVLIMMVILHLARLSVCLSVHISLQLLFHLIIDHLADFSASPDVFSMFAEQLKKTYFNILIKPEKLGK